MSRFFDELSQGIQEAIAIERGQLKGRKTTYVIEPVKRYSNEEVKKIRNSAGMTQTVFATYMGVSTKTVEAWEKGTNHPTGSACRLLAIIESGNIELMPFLKIKHLS